MKKLFTTFTAWIALGAAVPAFAGPDWQVIEQARENKRTQVAQTEKLTPAQKCDVKRLVLPLDHGPRAQLSPYLNQRRSDSAEADLKACKEAAAKGVTP